VAELDELSAAYSASYEVTRIEEPAGPAATREDLDVLVVSPEASAQRRAHRLNRTRADEGLRPLEVYTPPFVVAEDGDRISSSDDKTGKRVILKTRSPHLALTDGADSARYIYRPLS
jgi:pantetheine-phosphate adenylyltransferase